MYLQTDGNELHFKQQLNSVLQILTSQLTWAVTPQHKGCGLKALVVQSSKMIPSKSPS